MSLRAMLVYLQNEMHEEFRFFRAGNSFVVLQLWRQMLFFIKSEEFRAPELLRLQLQQVREILIFLFGTRFEEVMSRNISLSKRTLFASYVDAYLDLCNSDYLYLIGALRPDLNCKEIGQFFSQGTATFGPSNRDLLCIVLFHASRVVAKYEPVPCLEEDTLAHLAIFERVEFPKKTETTEEINKQNEELQNSEKFDSQFVSEHIRHKGCYIKMDEGPIPCIISFAQCSSNSPFEILSVTKGQKKMTPEVRKGIERMLTGIVQSLQSLIVAPLQSHPLDTDALHFVIVNRSPSERGGKGSVWEQPLSESSQKVGQYLHLDLNNQHLCRMAAIRLARKMAMLGMTAMMKGYTTMITGENQFQFVYEMRFTDQDGEFVQPRKVFKPPSFDDDTTVNYDLITNTLFDGDEDIKCYELFAVYAGRMPSETVLRSTEQLFDTYKKLDI